MGVFTGSTLWDCPPPKSQDIWVFFSTFKPTTTFNSEQLIFPTACEGKVGYQKIEFGDRFEKIYAYETS